MKIPRIFHFIWIGGKPLPDEFKYYRQTWKTLHPNWEIKTWKEKDLNTIINWKEFNEGGIVLKVDLLKLEILYNNGGVFVDFDFECYKNIEPLIHSIDIFSAGEEEGMIGNAIMGATPKHPIFKKLIEKTPQSIKENKDYGPNIKTGPIFMTKTLTPDEITVFGPKLFFPTKPGEKSPAGQSQKYPEAYANHHWAASWVGKEDKIPWEEYCKKEGKNL